MRMYFITTIIRRCLTAKTGEVQTNEQCCSQFGRDQPVNDTGYA